MHNEFDLRKSPKVEGISQERRVLTAKALYIMVSNLYHNQKFKEAALLSKKFLMFGQETLDPTFTARIWFFYAMSQAQCLNVRNICNFMNTDNFIVFLFRINTLMFLVACMRCFSHSICLC